MNSNQVEIFLYSSPNSGQTLDINVVEGFGITYSIDDIRNIKNRSAAGSKTIKLPGTKKNNFLLGNLFDINSDFSSFNPNIKTKAKILVNGTPVIDGFLQLRNITKHQEQDLEGNLIEYDVVINDNSIDFYSKIENKDLTELSLSGHNHVWDYDAVRSAWTANTWSDVYQYPLLFNGDENFGQGTNDYIMDDFPPAIYHKAYLRQIGVESGFEFGGPFWTSLSEYEKEIIPFNGDSPDIKEQTPLQKNFRTGISADKTTINIGSGLIGFIANKIKIRFDEDSTLPNYDQSGVFNTTTNTWEVSSNTFPVTYDSDAGFKAEVILSAITTGSNKHRLRDPDQIFSPYVNGMVIGNPTNVNLNLEYKIIQTDSLNQLGFTITQEVELDTSGNLFPGTGTDLPETLQPFEVISGTTTFSLQPFLRNNTIIPVNNRDMIVQVNPFLTYNGQRLPNTLYYTINGNNNMNGMSFRTTIKIFKQDTQWETIKTIDPVIAQGETINLNSVISKDLKQSDIIDDLVKRYNLYYTIDPDNSKKLLLYTRDQFYSGATTLNWTNKKDYSTPDQIQFLPELQNKEILFTYSTDDDLYNKTYTEITKRKIGRIYGQKRIQFENEFVKGELKIESPFSPTPLIKNKIGDNYAAIVPAIKSVSPKIKPRILYWGGLINTLNSSKIWITYWNSSTKLHSLEGRTTYPFAGHFDHPFSSTLDINFEKPDFLFYIDPISGATMSASTNNLFNKYWRNYINQISEGKLVTSKFNLKEPDINFIKDNMNSKIFVKDSYYYINKIIDYDPTNDELTEVELLKINEGISFKPIKEQLITIVTPGWTDVALKPERGPAGSDISIPGGDGVALYTGRKNVVSPASENIVIIGSGNTIDSRVKESGIIGGNNNKIEQGVRNSWVISSNNKTISRSNEVWVGNLHILNGNVQTDVNVIDGGIDEVQSLYSINEINQIEGGENEVRAPFARNSEFGFTFEGGRNSVEIKDVEYDPVVSLVENTNKYSYIHTDQLTNPGIRLNSLREALALTTQGTWSIWVKFDDITPATAEVIISFGKTSAAFLQMWIDTDGTLRANGRNNSNTQLWQVKTTTAAPFTVEKWHQCIVVQDGVSPVLYIDGVAPAITFPFSSDKTLWFGDGLIFEIANLGSERGVAFPLNGNLDECYFFDVALTAAEVTELYNSGKQLNIQLFSKYNNLIAGYRLGEDDTHDGVTWTIKDFKGGNNGTFTAGDTAREENTPFG